MAAAWESAPLVESEKKRSAWEDAPIVGESESDGMTSYQKAARKEGEGFAKDIAMAAPNAVAGGVRGAGSIGATILAPYDMAKDAMAGKGLSLESNRQRRTAMDEGFRSMGADPDSAMYKIGKVGAEVAGTAGVGGGLAALSRAAAPSATGFANALATSGMRAGSTPGAKNMLTRMAGGGISGGTAAGMVDPEYTGVGAGIGAFAPPVLAAAGKTGGAIGSSIKGGGVSPEVNALAARAKDLGIDIPADRLVNSRPLNAVASGLNYVPFSGRAATETRMEKQLTKAAANLIGQDTDNMALALRKASTDLGGKFDNVLKNNAVKFDKQLMDELTSAYNTAQKELGSDGLKAISSQIDELIAKGGSGAIDGQAAYNIKRTLDRIGRRNTPEAFHALELKKALMGALDRSLGPTEAAAFAKTRQQYGNMLSLEKIAKNGVEGDISVARLANMPNINNEPLQEIADIAAQFVKSREGQHGAMQRAFAAMGVGSLTGIPGLVATAAGGRGVNALLNSGAMKNYVSSAAPQNALGRFLASPEVAQTGYRSAPVIGAQ